MPKLVFIPDPENSPNFNKNELVVEKVRVLLILNTISPVNEGILTFSKLNRVLFNL